MYARNKQKISAILPLSSPSLPVDANDLIFTNFIFTEIFEICSGRCAKRNNSYITK
jgi:hypothetical protein